jgi:pimeloyl-ACP methyl ester carboxylesterase
MIDLRDVAAKGARIRFAVAGQGAPLLLVHDALSDRASWDAVVPVLAEKMQVIVPDLPGFGDSEKPPPSKYAYAHDAFAESLVDLVSSLSLGRISVCGHGLGAAIALLLAARHATLIDRIVLVSPTVYEPAPGIVATISTLPVVGSLLFKQVLGKTMFRRHFSWKMGDRRIEDLYASFSEPAARAAAHATLLAMRDPRPVVARLASARAPALVVGGRDDPLYLSQGRRLAREIGGRYEVLECGRAPHEEKPDVFSSVALAFLLETSGTKRSRGRAA